VSRQGARVLATAKGDARFGPGGIKLVQLDVKPAKPAWFRRIVERDFGGVFNAQWYDHPGSVGESLVVEPYQLSHEAITDLLDCANRYALNVSISGFSHHYPGRTVAVFLSQRNRCQALNY